MKKGIRLLFLPIAILGGLSWFLIQTKYTSNDAVMGVLVGGVISIISSFITNIMNYYQTEKTLTYQFKKEEYKKFEEVIEIIINNLTILHQQILIIKINIENKVHIEEDFSKESIKERFGNLGNKGNNYMYIYFKDFYQKYNNLILLHNEILNNYFNILNKKYLNNDQNTEIISFRDLTDYEKKCFKSNFESFGDKFKELSDLLIEEKEKYKKQLDL